MAYGASSAAAVAAYRAAIAKAIKASGAIVRLDAKDFMSILSRNKTPLVVVSLGGVFKKNYQYLTVYKGLIFFTKSEAPLRLPSDAEIVNADKIWIPD